MKVLLFRIDTLFKDELKKDVISSKIQKEFSRHYISLPECATQEQIKANEWVVTDGVCEYIIKEKKSILNVYFKTSFITNINKIPRPLQELFSARRVYFVLSFFLTVGLLCGIFVVLIDILVFEESLSVLIFDLQLIVFPLIGYLLCIFSLIYFQKRYVSGTYWGGPNWKGPSQSAILGIIIIFLILLILFVIMLVSF